MSVLVYDALERAASIVGPVVATERGEDDSRGRSREFYYPSAQAVLAVASAAMRAVRLKLVPLRVGPSVAGAQGPELPIVFGLTHADSGDQVEIKVSWPLADPSDFLGRPQAQAATVTMAEKHLLLLLLSIQIEVRAPQVQQPTAPPTPIAVPTAAEKHGTKLEDVGPMPGWAATDGVPAHLAYTFRLWQAHDFADRSRANPQASKRSWQELVGRVLVCEPRPCQAAAEEDAAARFMSSDIARLEATNRARGSHAWTAHERDQEAAR